LRDAIELEWAGVPSACIVHEQLAGSARAIARVSGHPDYDFATIGYPHIPTAVWTEEECRVAAVAVAPKIAAMLGLTRA
jgi:hypothetical protein